MSGEPVAYAELVVMTIEVFARYREVFELRGEPERPNGVWCKYHHPSGVSAARFLEPPPGFPECSSRDVLMSIMDPLRDIGDEVDQAVSRKLAETVAP